MSARKVGAKFVGRVLNAIDILSTARERSNNDNNRSNLEPLEPRDIRTGEKAAVIIQKMVRLKQSYFFNSFLGIRLFRKCNWFKSLESFAQRCNVRCDLRLQQLNCQKHRLRQSTQRMHSFTT